MLQPRQFCQETNIEENHKDVIASFWETRNEGQFIGRYGLRLQWCSFTKEKHTRAIILVNGRTESIMKYKEVFYDLFAQGYDVYSYDHRGQGLSQRLVVDSDIGHMVKFQHYVDDLENFIDLIVMPKKHKSRTLLAHSMGGAIATLYAAKKPNTIDKLVLCAPMFGIHMPKWLNFIAMPLSMLCAKLEHPASYAVGQKSYKEKVTEKELLTHSTARFEVYRQLFEANEKLQVGGPSARWVWQSLKISKDIQQAAKDIQIPILLLQGGKDLIVSNDAMFKFYHHRQHNGLPIQFEIQADGRHELLFEQDEIRDTVLNLILDFAQN